VRLADMRVGMRLGLAFGLLVVLMLVIAGLGVSRLSALNAEFTQIVVDRHSKTDLLHAIMDEVNLISRSVQGMLLVDGAEAATGEIAKIDAAKKNVSEMLERLDHTFANEGAKAKELQQEAHNKNSAYMVSLVRYTRLMAAGKIADAKTLLNTQLKAELDASFSAMQVLSRYQTALMQKSVEDAAASYLEARNLTIVLALVSIALALGVALWIARGIANPLRDAVGVAGRVAAGNLASRIHVGGNDEMGQLMSALKQMNESLTRIVGDVRKSSVAIASASNQLVGANNDLSQRTEEQASSLEETASSMEQFTASVSQNADNAKQASGLAENTSQVAAKGEAVVSRVVETMGAINESSKKIVDIIGVIDGIAFQTNILALNAAVEAARAGTHGHGFAVVAAEVRNLALRSATAAKEIKALIGDSVARVDEGTQLVDDAGHTMKEILTGIRQVADIMGDISRASQEQRSGISQVTLTLAQMEKITQQNAALVEQASAAMEMLEGQARHLVDAVRVFKLDEPEAGVSGPTTPKEAKPRLERKPRTVLRIAGQRR
jgi:methyl-accepting chemotaxis protein